MLGAVLFDWGDTLMQWLPEPELLADGHRAGLEALGRPDLPDQAAVTELFTERYMPLLSAPGTLEELEYPALVRELLASVGLDVTEPELERYLLAEHRAWAPARRLGSTTHAMLEALHGRGLRLGLVSNAFDPPLLLHTDLQEFGISERVDVAVFSSEIGVRKPGAAIFEHALDRLGVAPQHALFVGDRLVEDIGGAAALGMRTAQALWFRADEEVEGIEPDFQAFTQMDVLNIVERLDRAQARD